MYLCPLQVSNGSRHFLPAITNLSNMKKYEYKVIAPERNKFSGSFNAEKNEAILTGLGLDGWRFIDKIQYGGTTSYLIFEREIE